MDKVVALVTADEMNNVYAVRFNQENTVISKKEDRVELDNVIFPFPFFQVIHLVNEEEFHDLKESL